jgi:hypothetical protein
MPEIGNFRLDGGPLGSKPESARSGISDALLIAAVGIFLVALAYARGRQSLPFANPLFWTGQILIFTFIAFRVLKPTTSSRDREFLVILYAGVQSVIRWAYSPVMFQWFDELQHFRSLLNVVATHHLFHTNYSLPVSPRYPGLENFATEMAQVSWTSPFIAGTLVAGISHVMLPAAILLLFREVTKSSQIACIGVLLYMLSPQIHYFEASFVYENVAFPFLLLAILFSIRFATQHDRRQHNFAAMLACSVLAVMTHHVTAIATAGLLTCIALATSLFHDTRKLAVPLAKCAASVAVIVESWITFVAPGTRGYLGDVGPQILDGLAQLGHAQGKAKLPTSLAIPLIDRVCNPGGVALTLVLLAVAVRLARSLPSLQRLFIGMAPALYATMIFIRLFVGSSANGEHPDGAELAVRSLTYGSIFTALAIAVVLNRLVSVTAGRYRGLIPYPKGLVSATVIAVLLFMHSTTTGLPQYWQRIPGPFKVDSFASGIDIVGTSRAEWAAANLQSGSRYFGDMTAMVLLSALSDLDPVSNPGTLYDTSRLIPEDSALIGGLSATYLDVDTRMALDSPITRYFFKADAMMGNREAPLLATNLAKFDDFGGISRIYDSGYDHFYDLRGMQDIYGS